MWQVRGELEQILGLGRRRRDRRLPRHHDARLARPADRRAPAGGRGRRARTSRPSRRRGCSNRLRHPQQDRGWINRLRGKDLHNGALVVIDYRTGDVRAYVGSAGYYLDGLAEPPVRAQVRRRRASASGSRARRSSRSSTRRRSSAKVLTPGSACCSTSPRTSTARRTGRPRTPTASSAGRSSSARRSRCRSTSRRSAPSSASATPRSPTRRRRWASRSRAASRRSWQAGLAGALGTVEVRPLDLVVRLRHDRERRRPRAAADDPRDPGPDGKVVWRAPDAGHAGDVRGRPPTR